MSASQVMFVTPRHTVMIAGTANGPGTMVTLPHDESAFLASRGFLQDTAPLLPVPGTALNRPSGR
jgi:hypothetical protein